MHAMTHLQIGFLSVRRGKRDFSERERESDYYYCAQLRLFVLYLLFLDATKDQRFFCVCSIYSISIFPFMLCFENIRTSMFIVCMKRNFFLKWIYEEKNMKNKSIHVQSKNMDFFFLNCDFSFSLSC